MTEPPSPFLLHPFDLHVLVWFGYYDPLGDLDYSFRAALYSVRVRPSPSPTGTMERWGDESTSPEHSTVLMSCEAAAVTVCAASGEPRNLHDACARRCGVAPRATEGCPPSYICNLSEETTANHTRVLSSTLLPSSTPDPNQRRPAGQSALLRSGARFYIDFSGTSVGRDPDQYDDVGGRDSDMMMMVSLPCISLPQSSDQPMPSYFRRQNAGILKSKSSQVNYRVT